MPELDRDPHPVGGEQQTRQAVEDHFVGAGDSTDVIGENDPAAGHTIETDAAGGTHR